MFPIANKERFEKLKLLSPAEAISAWLEGDFGVGDEPALVSAILKDTRIKLSPGAVEELLTDVMDDEEADAQAILDRLAGM